MAKKYNRRVCYRLTATFPADVRERLIASAEAEGISVSEWICRAAAAVLGIDGLERPRVGNPDYIAAAKPKPKPDMGIPMSGVKPSPAVIVESAPADPVDSALSIFD